MEELRLFSSLRHDPVLLEAVSRGFANAGWIQKTTPYYMLVYHRDRLVKAATHWGWPAAVNAVSGDEGLERLKQLIQDVNISDGDKPHRVQILLSRDGTLEYKSSIIPKTGLENLFPTSLPPPSGEKQSGRGNVASRTPQYQVFLDKDSTMRSEYTHFKTTKREMYDSAMARTSVGALDEKEVLLINQLDSSIMEGSRTTPYFWRNGRWVTPPVATKFDMSQGSGGHDGTTRRWALER